MFILLLILERLREVEYEDLNFLPSGPSSMGK